MKILRLFLTPLTVLYYTGLKLHKLFSKSFETEVKVLSVGNITTGGVGKTPMVIKLSQELKSKYVTAVVSRGYGRKNRGLKRVNAGTADDFGDEPLLIKKRVPDILVIVAENKLEGVRYAESQGSRLVILDDGFQSWVLKRDLDMIIIDCLCPFGGGRLLPAGRLREPLSSLSRAHCIVLNRSNLVAERELDRIKKAVLKFNPQARIFTAYENTSSVRNIKTKETVEPAWFLNKKVVCMSGIGNPEGFHKTVQRMGAEIVSAVNAPDHYCWTDEEWSYIFENAAKKGEYVLTTEKDAVRLPEKADIWAVAIDMVINEEKEWGDLINEI